ncbi:MAG: phosphonate ABC transporter ATP-binding protein [Rubrivivax sp.]
MGLAAQGLTLRHPAARPGAAAAVQSLDLQLAPGEQVAVIGPSGAGKTSLLHGLAAALRPSAGRLCLGDADPWALRPAALRALRGRLFLAPQVPPLPPRQRVVTAVLAGRLPTLGLAASLLQWFKPQALPEAYAALQRFDLGDKLFERVDRLSGGERQRVGLARALLSPAGLWLVDEPLSALDPTRAVQALQTLLTESRQRGTTLLASLHQVDLALAHFPRTVGLRDGRVAFDLPSAQVTPTLLQALYAQHEAELHGAPPRPPGLADGPIQAAAPSAPAAMHCR